MSQGLWGEGCGVSTGTRVPLRQPCGSLSSWFVDQDEEENVYLMVIDTVTLARLCLLRYSFLEQLHRTLLHTHT